MSGTVEEIKNRLNILEVVAPYVKLIKAGKYHKGLSPFTKEKTPSFFVSPDRGLYHCFSSGKGGDMFTFIQELEGVDFRGALKILAEKAGVPITNEPPEKRDLKEKLYAALRDADEHYREHFEKNDAARKYVEGRGIEPATYRQWGVGYAPEAWRDTYAYLLEKGHPEALIEEAGLVKRPERSEQAPEKKPYDRFRGRILFPLRDASGRTVGFSGRAFASEEGHTPAKYLNSPETALFDKSRFLYGMDFAKNEIRKYGFSILVEGQFDVLLAHQAGYRNTVAVSGTSFTEHHAQLLQRYSDNVVIAFDADSAGVAAAGRAAQSALSLGLNVKIALLPDGEDPADLIQRDVTQWRERIKNAQHVIDFYMSYTKSLGYDVRRERLEISRVVLPYVALIKNAIDKAHFVQRVAEVLSVPDSAVETELKKLETPLKTGYAGKSASHFSAQKEEAPYAPAGHSYEPFLSRADTLERLLVGVMQSLKTGDHTELGAWLEKKLHTLLGVDGVERVLASPEAQRGSVIEGDLFLEEHSGYTDTGSLLEGLLADLEKEIKRNEYRSAVMQLRQAEQEGNEEHIQTLLRTVSVLAKGL